MLEDGVAGRAAVEVLIESGKLVPDFWLRAKAESKSRSDSYNTEIIEKQISDAVKFAMGAAGVQLPEWASPSQDSPDCVWIYPEFKNRFPSTEPYYFPFDLYRSLARCHGNVDLDTKSGQELRKSYLNTAWRSWHRLIPHFSQSIAQDILGIENERGNNGFTFSKSARRDAHIEGASIRDAALYDFYIEQGETGLKQVFHGIGKKAILGVGAMLFLSGEHDDLIHTAEQLSDVLNRS